MDLASLPSPQKEDHFPRDHQQTTSCISLAESGHTSVPEPVNTE
jgi:hypothetical protein